MYSRVGTTDWNEKLGEEQFKKMLENDIRHKFIVADTQHLRILKKEARQKNLQTEADLLDALRNIQIPSLYENVINAIGKLINQDDIFIDVSSKRRFETQVSNSPHLKSLLNAGEITQETTTTQ